MERSRLVRTLLVALGVVGVLTIAAGIFVVSLLRQDMSKVELSFRLEAGKSYAFHCEESSEVTDITQGKEEKNAATVTLDYTFEVQEVDGEGNAVINVTCDRMQMEHSGPDGESSYDSSARTEVAPGVSSQVATLAQGFSMTLSPKGRVLALEVPEPEASDIFGEEPEGLSEELAAQLEQFREEMGSDLRAQQQKMMTMTLRMLLEGALAIYAEGPVGPADSWRRQIDLGDARLQMPVETFEFKRHKKGLAVITVRSEGRAQFSPTGASRTETESAGSAEGTIEVDKATGHICREVVQGEMSVSSKTRGGRSEVLAAVVEKRTVTLLPKE